MPGPFLRFAALLLWVLSLVFLAVSLALVAMGSILRDDSGGQHFAELLNRHLTGANITYDRAEASLSLRGLHFRAHALTVGIGDSRIAAGQGDFWLQDKRLKIVLQESDFHIATLRADGDSSAAWPAAALPIELEARAARLAAAGVTLANADIHLHTAADEWRLNLTEQRDRRRLHLRAAGRGAEKIRLYAEADNFPLLPLPFSWSAAQLTLAAELHDGLRYRLGGAFHRLQPDALTPPLETLVWRSDGSCAALARCRDSLQGDFHLRAQGALPYRPAVPVTIAAGGDWQRSGGGWRLSTRYLRASSNDASARATLTMHSSAPHLALAISGSIGSMAITAVEKHFPHGEVQQWMAESLLGGAVEHARFSFRSGSDSAATDTLQLTIAFSGGTLAIADGWPLAEQLGGTLKLSDNTIRILGAGVYDELTVPFVTAHIPDIFSDAPATLALAFDSAAPLLAAAAAARRSPAAQAAMQQVDSSLALAGGEALLSLAVSVPLAQPAESRVQGLLEVGQGELAATVNLPPYRSVQGSVYFNNDSLQGSLQGTLPAADGSATPMRAVFDKEALTLRGVADIALLMSVADIQSAPLAGSTSFTVSRTAAATVFTAPLDGTVIDLPYPVGKGARASAALSLRADGSGIRGSYRSRAATIRLQQRGGGSDIAINAASRTPPQEGINLHGAASNVNLDLWLGEGGGGAPRLATVMLTLSQADLMGVTNEHFIVRGERTRSGQLSLDLDTSNAVGRIVSGEKALRADFSRLEIPLKNTSLGGSSGSKIASLTVALSAATLVVGGLTLGAVTLAGAPANGHWQLDDMRVYNLSATIRFSGAYRNSQTSLTVQLDAHHLPALMHTLDIPPVFGNGRLSLSGSIGWDGAPTNFRASAMTGDLHLAAENVRYSDIAFGTNVVNVLSAFAPQSLFSLGFTELADGGGVTFDEVRGNIVLKNGAAHLQPLSLSSDDLRMSIDGSTSYLYRRHNLHGRVRPGRKLLGAGSTVGLATGLTALNPATFVAGTLLGKLLEEPLSEIGAYDYTITGSWKDPVYEEIGFSEQPEG